MATEITLPELGENLEGGEVVDVKVNVGDEVREGQTLIEVEAEKSTVEVPAPATGRVAKLLVHKGDHVTVGQSICLLESEETGGKKEEGDGKQKTGGKREEKKESEEESPEQLKPEPPSRKPVEKPRGAPAAPAGVPGAPSKTRPSETLVPAGPATRRLARELGVDLQRVMGSGPHGRVTREDIKAHVRQITATGGNNVPAAPALPDFEHWGPVERQPLTAIRRRTAAQMSLAWSLIPHVTQHDLADITDLDAFRRQQETPGTKLTVTAFALKAAVLALKQFPSFNGSLDLAAGQMIVKRYYHIGVAVDTEHGLLVPVLRDVDRKGVRELADELAALAERARQKKLAADDMQGGTFTITNLGGIGGTAFTPIIRYPEVAILGMSRARSEAVVRAGQVVPRLMLPLSLSYDHRIIDGADAARFTRRIASLLENPMLMLL